MALRLTLFFVFCCCTRLLAQAPLQFDTAAVEVRSFDNAALNNLKADRDFRYDQLIEPTLSWWDKMMQWFWWKVEQLLKTKGGKTTLWSIFIIFGIAAIAFFVMKVTGMNRGALFGRSSGTLPYTTATEDINLISFDEAIGNAIRNANYRLATRLLYLQTLKKLSDKGFIEWQIDKTNTDYVREVQNKPWSATFNVLTFNFEYTWYGETQVPQDRFNELQQAFQQFYKQVQ